jgi:tetratricopeptide (TPR) repeat protein
VAEHFRIDELTRRLEQDPSSIAFAQLAEALRRAGRLDEAVAACRAGLVYHPEYLSAHVTLGRALIEQGDLEAAQTELTGVLAAAPENLAAIRGLAEIHQQRGHQGEALEQYRRALTLAPHDPDLEETVSRLAAGLDASPRPEPSADVAPGDAPVEASAEATAEATVEASAEAPAEAPPAADVPAVPTPAAHQIEALERWLDAILADRERQA